MHLNGYSAKKNAHLMYELRAGTEEIKNIYFAILQNETPSIRSLMLCQITSCFNKTEENNCCSFQS